MAAFRKKNGGMISLLPYSSADKYDSIFYKNSQLVPAD
jgi:hypothetical protein